MEATIANTHPIIVNILINLRYTKLSCTSWRLNLGQTWKACKKLLYMWNNPKLLHKSSQKVQEKTKIKCRGSEKKGSITEITDKWRNVDQHCFPIRYWQSEYAIIKRNYLFIKKASTNDPGMYHKWRTLQQHFFQIGRKCNEHNRPITKWLINST